MADPDRGQAVSDEQILTVFAELDESPLYSWEIADELPADADDVETVLDDLEERGLVESDDEFAPGTVWRLAPDVNLSDLEVEGRVETDTEAQATATGSQASPRDQETTESPPAEPGEETSNPPYRLPTDAIESFDPPGSPAQKTKRREALRHAYSYLRQHERVDREEFVKEVYPAYRGAYHRPTNGWWERVIRPGLASLPDVEQGQTPDEWVFVGSGEERSSATEEERS